MKKKGLLIDNRFCIGCNSCLYKCIQENRLFEEANKGLFRTTVYFDPGGEIGKLHKRCMHCERAECEKICPEGAIEKTVYGPVIYDEKKCTGCMKCVKACPYNAIEFDKEQGKIVKCSMCAHRVGKGEEPACVEACFMGAISFGDYKELLEKAKSISLKEGLYILEDAKEEETCLIILTLNAPAVLGYKKY